MTHKNTPKWIQILKNKYVITLIVFAVIVLGLSNNNVFVIHRLKKEVRQLEKEEQIINEGIASDSIQANILQSDLEAIERYGRETYYMKRANEDIYVVDEEEE